MIGTHRRLLLVPWFLLAVFASLARANHFILPCDQGCVPSRWVATGSMNVPRWGHSATLLPDGTVLVAGGYSDAAVPLDSAELYDPATKSWRTTGRMALPRTQHTATLLRNGKVLVTGSADGASTELYDPATGSWTATGRMNDARSFAAATLLADGRVLVAGGLGAGTAPTALKSAELYDPATGRWERTGDLVHGRWGAPLVTLKDGRVLTVMGGDGADLGNPVPEAELYDPASGTWRPAGRTGFAMVGPTASLLDDGRVLVVGGDSGMTGAFGSAWMYDPQAAAWQTLPDPRDPHYALAAAVLPGGDVLVLGGEIRAGTAVHYSTYGTVLRFNVPSRAWSREDGLLDAGRRLASLTVLRDGTALVAGGVVYRPQDDGIDVYSVRHVLATSNLYIPGSVNAVLNVGCVTDACDGATGLPGQGRDPRAIEYYHPGLDHYFLSASPGDLEALDAHRLDGWARTGGSFPVALAPDPTRRLVDPVCRFYLPPASGDAHFFSASPAECAEVAGRFPSFLRETDAAFYVALPDVASGACPADAALQPVYRLWNGRVATNHRYTTARIVRDRMVALGYVAEGYGPDGVAFCVP